MKTPRLNPVATRLAVAVALTLSARGANITWVGNTSVNWADTNWSGTNNPPIAGDVLIFGVAGSAGPVLNNNLTAGLTFNGITFNPGGSAFTFNGNGITLAGNVTNSGTALQTINLPITSAAVTARLFTTTTGGGDITLGGLLSGNLSPSKAGVGTLNITGTANTYISETIFGAGIVNVASLADYGVPSSLGARTFAQENGTTTGVSLHFRGGALQYTGSTPQSTNRNIRILNGVNGGIIDASGSDPSATLSFTKTGANINLFDTAGTRTMNLIGSNTGNNSFSIQLTNQGTNQTTLRKAGTGTWLIPNSDNTYTGETIIEGGILNVASVSDYGVASSIGSRALSEENNTVTGVSLHFLGGTLQYTGSTPQSTNRNIRVFIGNGATIDASGSVPSATLSFTKTGPNQNLFDTGGARTITLTGTNTGDNGFSIPIDNQSTNPTSLTKSGVGTWVLNGPDTNPGLGATTVEDGVLKLAKVNALAVSGPLNIGEGAAEIAGTGGNQIINTSTVTFTGANGALRLKGLTETIGGLSSGGGGFVENEAAGTGTLTVSFAGSHFFGGTIRDGDGAGTDGQLALTKSGSGQLTLSGSSTHTGATTVEGGMLTVDGTLGAGSTVTISNATVNGIGTISGPVNVQVGGTLATDGTLGGSITLGLGGTLSGIPTITGSVTAASGSLISPATAITPGTLTTAALTLNSGSTLAFEFGATNDLVVVTNAGGLTLNGGAFNVLEPDGLGGVMPLTTNGTFALFDYNTNFNGPLSNLSVANSQFGKSYSIEDGAGTVINLVVGTVSITEWDGGAANGLWSADNWTLAAPNAVSAAASFGQIPAVATAVTVDGPKTVGGILFDNANGYTVTGGPTDIVTLNNNFGAAIISVVNGSHTISAPLNLATAVNATTALGTTLNLTGNITGAKPFIAAGAGTTILTGTNSFTTTAVAGGTLQVGNGSTTGTLGTSDVTIAPAATLVFNRSDDVTLANNISGGGAQVTKLGAGTLTLTGTNTFSTATGGSFNINAGTVKVGNATALATGVILNLGGGSLDLNQNDLRTSSLSGTSGSITDNGLTAGTTTIFVDQAVDTTYAGSINNGLDRTIAVKKSGTGALTLGGSNSFTGTLSITQGAVIAAGTPDPSILSNVVELGDGTADVLLTVGTTAPQQFGANTVINFTNGGANAKFQTRGTTQTVAGLDANAPFQTTKAIIQNDEAGSAGFGGDPGVGTLIIDTDGTHSFTGLIRNEVGTLNLVKNGPGTQEIKNALVQGNNFGSISVNEGKFIVNLAPNAGGTNVLGVGTTAFIGTEGTLAFDGAFSFNQAISGTGSLLKQGTGQVTLTATNTFIGTTTLQGGNLVASAVGGGSLGGNVLIGNGTQAGIFLIMTQPNQFGPNSVLTWNNGAGDAKLELRGTAQTVAGLRSDPDDILSIVQNQETGAPVAATLTITATEDHVFTGLIRTQIGGPLSLIKNGPGTQEIRNVPAQAHNFGNLTIDEGKFVLNFNGANNTLGAGTTTTIAAGAILGLDGTWNMNRTITGAGKVLKSGDGAVTISGTQTYAELETVGNGTLTLTTALPAAAIDNTSGTLNINASVAGSSLNVEGTTNISVSQTLTSLTIADGGTVVLGPAAAPGDGAAFGDGFGGDAKVPALGETFATSVEAVPEPGALGLLATGILGLLSRRRRVAP